MQWTCIGFTISSLFYCADSVVYWTEVEKYDDIHLYTYFGGCIFYFGACIVWISHEFPQLLPYVHSIFSFEAQLKGNSKDDSDRRHQNSLQMC